MQTVFMLDRNKNTGLFPLVLGAFETGAPAHGVILFRDLHWRKMPSNRLAVEIYGEPVTQLPEALKLASYDLHLYDFRDDKQLKIGGYKYKSAYAQVIYQSPGLHYIYEIAVVADKLRDLNELYRLILAGAIMPYQE